MSRCGPTPESVYERNCLFNGIDELHLELFESLLEAGVLFDRIKRLPLELFYQIIETSVFSEPFGSHEALHTLRLLYEELEENKGSIIRERIQFVFGSCSIQERIETDWKLCPDFEHTKTCSHTFDKQAAYDLASWAIANCPPCFNFMLDRKAIRASSYCQTGDSFFVVASKAQQLQTRDHLVSLMKPGDLNKPYSANRTDQECVSIFRLSALVERAFRSCWDRLKPQPEVSQSSLGSDGVQYICRFADANLANELFERGVDLGSPSPDNPVPYWHNIVRQEHPESMLVWLCGRGYQCPNDMLTYVSTNIVVNAVPWVVSHTEDYEDWRQATVIAAKHAEPQSVDILGMILKHKFAEEKADATFYQNLFKTIVQEACDNSLETDEYLQKIRLVKGLCNITGVADLEIQAELAGLHRLTEALKDLEGQPLVDGRPPRVSRAVYTCCRAKSPDTEKRDRNYR